MIGSVATAAYERVSATASSQDDVREWHHVRKLAEAEGLPRIVEEARRQLERIASEKDAARFGMPDLTMQSPAGVREAWVRRAEHFDESDSPRGYVLVKSTAGEFGIGEIVPWGDEAGPRGRGWRIEVPRDAWYGDEDAAHADFVDLIGGRP